MTDGCPSKHLRSEIAAVMSVRLFDTPLIVSVDPALRNESETITNRLRLLAELDNIELTDNATSTTIPIPNADEWMSLFGTALIQEKAGLAFRAASGETDINLFDVKPILDGIKRLHENGDGQVSWHKPAPVDRTKVLAGIASCLAPNGAIAAAPAPTYQSEPNYWFCWQRDAGRIALILSSLDPNSAVARNYVGFLLTTRRPADMAVSRFTMSGRAINAYGSPQLDGPAYSALAILKQTEPLHALDAARPYLQFLCSEEADGLTYDAWEFSIGRTFDAVNLARKAIRKGLAFAQHDELAAKLRVRETQLLLELEQFWNEDASQLDSCKDFAIEWMSQLQRVDVAVIGSVLFDYDVTDNVLNVDDPRVRATMKRIEACFAERWPINRHWRQTLGRQGHGLGRFPEDMNDGKLSTGGNPWTFATLWGAQYYARLIERLDYTGVEDSGPNNREGLRAKANGFLDFVLAHSDPYSLNEQIDGFTGKPRGARNLGWAQCELALTLVLLDR